MPLPAPANTTCTIYRAGTSPAPVWNDPCTGADGTDITAHAPAIPSGGAYQYSADNTGAVEIESNALQGVYDGSDNRFYFDPGLPDPSTVAIDFKYTNSGSFPVDSAGYSGYYLRVSVRYGNDAGGGDGFQALIRYNGSVWVLTLYQTSGGVPVQLNAVNLALAPDTWFTLQIGTDGMGNVTAGIVGQNSTSAATGGALASNTQVLVSFNTGNEMALRNIVVNSGGIGPFPCILASQWATGQYEGERRVSALNWTHFMLVDPSVDVRDGYTGAGTFSALDTVYIPDRSGIAFTVIFVELCERGPRQFKRAFLDRGSPNWPVDNP